ncbi:MAG: TRAP transporter substrate-binding protein [Chromatiales bacterium]|jgi:C4-dicarboxylate-binding protein DctP|nr:TRAP transporter substrate-binding protein [Chromatiales bacterium]
MNVAPMRLVRNLAATAVVLCTAGSVAAAEQYRWTYAGYPSTEISAGKAIVYFAKEVEKRSNGRVKFDLHHRGSLYQEEKAIEAMLTGAIDFAAAATSNIGVFTRHYDWVNLPFIADGDIKTGPSQLLRMLHSDVGKELQAKVEAETGIKAVFFMPSNGGARALATRSVRIVLPKDVAKMKTRVSLAPLDVIINSQWGNNPLPVPWADALTGFSQGMFESIQIPIPHIHNVGFDEVAKYVTMVNFQYVPQMVWTTTKLWNSLPPDLQKIINEVGLEASQHEIKVDLEAHMFFRDAMQKRNTEIIDLTPEQMAMWVKASAPVYEHAEVKKYTPPDVLKRLKAAANSN